MNDISDKDPLVDNLLAKIKEEKISPHSKFYFTIQEYGVWTLWFLTIIVGAIAVAVTFHTFFTRYFDFHEVIRETFWLYAFEVLPYLWLVTVFFMLFLGVSNLRHTNHGYRYSLWSLIVSSVLGSLGGGLVLYVIGFGFLIDSTLGTYIDSYESQDKVERFLWQDPQQGRLFGDLVTNDFSFAEGRVQDQPRVYMFMDDTHFLWRLDTSELADEGLTLLQTGEPVRLLGVILSDEPAIFLVCGVSFAQTQHDHPLIETIIERNTWKERMSKMHQNDVNFADTRFCPQAVFMKHINVY